MTTRDARTRTSQPTRGRPRPRDRNAWTPLHDYGVIGNLHTAALISRFGSIDWACFPRYAAPSVFGRILDLDRGGFHEIRPVEPARPVQGYVPSTNILLTRFALPRGRNLDLVDFMPVVPSLSGEGAPMIVRLVEASGGTVPLQVSMEPRFEYGRRRPRWSEEEAGLVARDPTGSILYRSEWPERTFGRRTSEQVTLNEGERGTVEIIWGERRPIDTPSEGLLRMTERFWRSWVHTPETAIHAIAGRWDHWVERSELLLKLLSHADTGAFVAAPTTSLPEWPGGSRNWDYRFVWIRDAAFTAQALLLLGHLHEARAFLRWVLSRAQPGGQLRVLYDAHGRTDLAERTLRHLRGYLGSRPVRVGNGAVGQFQLDIYGEILDAATLVADVDPEFLGSIWTTLSQFADDVTVLWRKPDRGIWEIRAPAAHYVHSKVMAWVALDRSVRLAERFGLGGNADSWQEAANKVRAWVLGEGCHRRGGFFLQAAGRAEVDAANLRIPLVGFLPFEDPRVVATVDRIRSVLGAGPFVYRYRGPDGIPDPDNTFLPAAFWLVECLARGGRRRQALANWKRLLAVASPLGLYSEEYDPHRRLLLGNFPQAFTHIGVLRAALALGLQLSPGFLREELAWFPDYYRSVPPATARRMG